MPPFRLIQENSGAILEEVVCDVDKSGPHVIQDLTRVNPEAIVPKLVELSVNAVNSADLRMSMNDYAIYLTPEGQVYDQTIIESLREANDAKNIKRESKVLPIF